MKIFNTSMALCVLGMINTAQADIQRITHEDLQLFKIGSEIECHPIGSYNSTPGFNVTLRLTDGGFISGRVCAELRPYSNQAAIFRQEALESLTRIQENDISYKDRGAQSVCFTTVANYDTETRVLTFDQTLVKCP